MQGLKSGWTANNDTSWQQCLKCLIVKPSLQTTSPSPSARARTHTHTNQRDHKSIAFIAFLGGH